MSEKNEPSVARRAVKAAKLLLRLPGLLGDSWRVGRRLGAAAGKAAFRANVAFWSSDAAEASTKRQILEVPVRGLPFPVALRTHSSDILVFEQVLCDGEYAPLMERAAPAFVLDCGANVGYTAVALLARYPAARLVAVEPDAGNAEMCRRNLAPYGDRAQVVEAGVWSRDASLRVERVGFRDDREWSFRVRECAPGEVGEVEGVSIATLMKRAGVERIDLLKMDIEGSEQNLFADGPPEWLARVDCLAVETHGPECRAALMGAVGGGTFDVVQDRETTYCYRRNANNDAV